MRAQPAKAGIWICGHCGQAVPPAYAHKCREYDHANAHSVSDEELRAMCHAWSLQCEEMGEDFSRLFDAAQTMVDALAREDSPPHVHLAWAELRGALTAIRLSRAVRPASAIEARSDAAPQSDAAEGESATREAGDAR
jgi:hypothetical protein